MTQTLSTEALNQYPIGFYIRQHIPFYQAQRVRNTQMSAQAESVHPNVVGQSSRVYTALDSLLKTVDGWKRRTLMQALHFSLYLLRYNIVKSF